MAVVIRVGDAATAPAFPDAARTALADPQLRRNVRHATEVIRNRRAAVVGEVDDWQALREAGRRIKDDVLLNLDRYLELFERNCTRAGGHVHRATDADEANRIVVDILRGRGVSEIIKVKTMTSDETRLNVALEAAGITPYETDLADLIIQLGHDVPSHIVVPALHKNRRQIRELFMQTMGLTELGEEPAALTQAARAFLREKFLRVRTGFSGANFLVADTGGVCVVESEGNGRMCLTLPDTLVTLAGIEKIVPTLTDLEVFLQLLPRSATGERMNPYNSVWTGVTPGDGPREFHVVLLDNGRRQVLGDEAARSTLACIRCGACLNQCPVYRQTGGHAYGSIYSGPIGAILTPQLQGMQRSTSLPYASSLCGACYEVCPVKINIPEILIHLRQRLVSDGRAPLGERVAMKAASVAFGSGARVSLAHRAARVAQKPFARDGVIRNLPGMLAGWTSTRDLPALPAESFRQWWAARKGAGTEGAENAETISRRDPQRAETTDSNTGAYQVTGTSDTGALVDLFASRIVHYDGHVLRTTADRVAQVVGETLAARGKQGLLVPEGLPPEWLPPGVAFTVDRDLSYDALDRSEGAVTACTVAIARTGTIVLTHGGGEGRRALTLVPDYHLSIVRADQIVETVPEGMRAIAARSPALVTFISGPSATADIEMTRIKGVHGPRTLDVIIVSVSGGVS